MGLQTQKWVYLSFVVFASIISFIFYKALFWLAAFYDLEARVSHFDLVSSLGSAVLGIAIFSVLAFRKDANIYMNEVFFELTQVAWPTVNEAKNTTIVVLIMSIVAGVVLGFVDILWTRLFEWIL